MPTITKSDPSPVSTAALDAYWRAANYLGAGQLYLKDNVLLERPLEPADIKPRILGHWGTQPGINLIYAHLNRLIAERSASVLLIVGPGHGAPAVLANLYLEGTLHEFEPDLNRNRSGIAHLMRRFSWPGGAASHVTAATPGAIHEGGELGYSLSHAFGAAFDHPDLIVACIVGDGEAETGPLAAAWQSNKFLDPATSGAVLPILHLNGVKLSGPTILGRMNDDELSAYFIGLGYRPLLVATGDDGAPHAQLARAFDDAYESIRATQREARAGGTATRPKWPLVILRTPKGMTGPKTLEGHPVEGTFRSHGIPIEDPANHPNRLEALEAWLRSYEPQSLFEDGSPSELVLSVIPPAHLRMGTNPLANLTLPVGDLALPEIATHAVAVGVPGASDASATAIFGGYLRDVIRLNADARNFRLFSPDETVSNRLGAVFEVAERAFMWPLDPLDEGLSPSGRVMEILSEHTCQGWLEGYLLTGRHGLLASYEAFAPIIDSMVAQYAKWLKTSREVSWRRLPASLNYLLTSHLWRQDHNGFSHQSPAFLDALLNKKSSTVRAYFPPDANTLLSVGEHCLRSHGYVNVIIAPKQPAPQWLDLEAAREHCAMGASVWDWACNDQAAEPQVVIAAAGDVPTLEGLAAVQLLHEQVPELRVRFANVVDLFALAARDEHPHGMETAAFEAVFTPDKPVVFAFHGYPRLVHELLHHRPSPERFHVRGYREEGTTSTPFDCVVRNGMSRYHLAIEALRRASAAAATPLRTDRAIAAFERVLAAHSTYIVEHGIDLPEVAGWRWAPGPKVP